MVRPHLLSQAARRTVQGLAVSRRKFAKAAAWRTIVALMRVAAGPGRGWPQRGLVADARVNPATKDSYLSSRKTGRDVNTVKDD
ncbi:hypothetical protein TRAPUB_11290 [Trametes pubescens]|uniref:Uncharacterized protein n=1 Tax=Trametes pubescens TaxID=154538 RepID=A0A1M2VXC5_TRAPU|nr:hypothetical protein TRAPUB_11290 [Trametes pubescens]